MITVSIESKNAEPQTIITKFNISQANWHLFTPNETPKEGTSPNHSQSAEDLAKDFYKKVKISA